jgi:hypothetical protein
MQPFNDYERTIVAVPARDPRRTLWAEVGRTTRKSLRRLIAAGKVKVADFWSQVESGNPWKHTHEWKPPAPKPQPHLVVGQAWCRRDGKEVRLTDSNSVSLTYPFHADGNTYTPDGMLWEGCKASNLDLVELISEAPAPARHLPGYHGDWIAAAVAMPTAADANCDGEVLRRPGVRLHAFTHWTQLKHEDQWRPLASQDKRPDRPSDI